MKKRAAKVRKKKKEEEEEDEGLCCCEYVNSRGERSHVAACCCDCEDLDDVFDRLPMRISAGFEYEVTVADVVCRRRNGFWNPAVKAGPAIQIVCHDVNIMEFPFEVN